MQPVVVHPAGLSSAEARKRLDSYGLNTIEVKKPTFFHKFLRQLISPISLMLLAASLLSYLAGRAFDMSFILVLLLLNVGISLIQEAKADRALELLKAKLKTTIKAYRDKEWQPIDSRLLVPDDLIELSIGSIVPADIKIIETKNVSINEAAVTGESLPKDKNPGDTAYSGTFLLTGLLRGTVTATGNRTEFGRTFLLAEKQTKKSLLERDILTVSSFLTRLSLICVALLTIVLLLNQAGFLDVLTLDLSLVIAGIPISLPTVMTMIISFGVLALSKKKVIVRRLSSLQDLANVDALFTDKTGTLTRNKIEVEECRPYGIFTKADVLRYAGAVAGQHPEDVINTAVLEAGRDREKVTVKEFTPADSDRKRGTLLARIDGKEQTVTLGASQVVMAFCRLPDAIAQQAETDIAAAAASGFRVLALAISEHGEQEMQLVGLLYLSDTLRSDSRATIAYLAENGITVRMLTGDNRAIASRVAADIGLIGQTLVRDRSASEAQWHAVLKKEWRQTAVFAEILPADKLAIVQEAAKSRTVAVTGDGINDLPAVKSAQVGIAVQNAVEALKESADLVLLGAGIGVIKDAILESRKIFARVYTYSVYRISESFRLIITITVLGVLLRSYPLTPIQLILLALLNDIPIISLAWNRVKVAAKPASIDVKKRFVTSTLFGTVGVANSLFLYLGARYLLHLPLPVIETMYFLKLTIGGHMLIYVAHTEERWWRFLPSKEVIYATFATQAIATLLAVTGLFMPAALSWQLAVFIWIWAFFWMQVTELSKYLQQRHAVSKG
ncbi:HAD-IC family P-type ATPase [Patescibacteria group bacterium]|nr:HAD-IC family P-type ATPase [Patescibacteria group bacterium]